MQIACLRRRQEDTGRGNLLRAGETTKRYALQVTDPHRFRAGAGPPGQLRNRRADHIGLDGPRANGGEAYAARAQLLGQAVHQPVDAGFGGSIGGPQRAPLSPAWDETKVRVPPLLTRRVAARATRQQPVR